MAHGKFWLFDAVTLKFLTPTETTSEKRARHITRVASRQTGHEIYLLKTHYVYKKKMKDVS